VKAAIDVVANAAVYAASPCRDNFQQCVDVPDLESGQLYSAMKHAEYPPIQINPSARHETFAPAPGTDLPQTTGASWLFFECASHDNPTSP
jgi:hypothetical protein